MAIYHLSAQVISRARGRSAVAAAAYRAAERLTDRQENRAHDYSAKQGVVHTEIMLPEGAPAWMRERATLWNAVEARENRKDAQLAREVQVSLPRELGLADHRALVCQYVQEQFVSQGMVADVAIHHDNPNNPHAHIMLTLRHLDAGHPSGFGQKNRAWNGKDRLLTWRREWEVASNRALMRDGHEARVDCRSLVDQGCPLTPIAKHGVGHEEQARGSLDVVRERLRKHDTLVRQNGEAILADPTIALRAITQQRATFTRQDVGRWLNSRTADAEQFVDCLERVMASRELVKLGHDALGKVRFSTHEMVALERAMLARAERLHVAGGHGVERRFAEQAERSRERSLPLSNEQRHALRHVLEGSGVAVVEGYAGAGKSHMLGAAREAWEASGRRVHGGALAGKAAEGLEVAAGISSRSLAAWEHAWRHGREVMQRGDVLVIDEAGMVGSRQLGRVLEHAEHAGAKVVLVGDIQQLQAIEAGAPMRAIARQVGCVGLQDIRRQEESWMRDATLHLAQGRVGEALVAYDARGHMHAHASTNRAMGAMVQAWQAHRRETPHATQIMLAYRRAEVAQLNRAARSLRRAAGELGEDVSVKTERGDRAFAQDDRVYFLKNDRSLGVKNGTLGTIERVGDRDIVVRLDGPAGAGAGPGRDGGARRVVVNLRCYNHLDHGYAATVHKAQGMTVHRAHVLASEHYDKHITYVAMSRHRRQVDLYYGRDSFRDTQDLAQVLGRARPKDMALDYEQAERDNAKLGRQVAGRGTAPDTLRGGQLEADERLIREASAPISRHYNETAKRRLALQHAAAKTPLDERAAWKQLPDVAYAIEQVRKGDRFINQLRDENARFAALHPIRVWLGISPTVYDAYRRKPCRLNDALAQAERARTTCQGHVEALWRDPKMRQQARSITAEHNERIAKAQRELPAALRAEQTAYRAIVQDIERRPRRERDLERGGLER